MSETYLLDANVLIALSFTDHVHHQLCTRWFQQMKDSFATCPMTQGALVRFAVRHAVGGAHSAKELLEALAAMDNHIFWSADLDCSRLPWKQIFGYRQVTDAYLVELANRHGGKLATLDSALATVFESAVLVSDSQS